MKTCILILIFLISFVGFYMLISCLGLFFTNYTAIISSEGWFMAYTLLIGPWVSLFIAREYYMSNEAYFNAIGL